MSFSTDILNNKGMMSLIIVLLISSMGLGVNNHLTGNTDGKMYDEAYAKVQVVDNKIINLKEDFATYIQNDKEKFIEHNTQHENDRKEDKEDRLLWLEQYNEDKREHNVLLFEILLQIQKLNMMICTYNGYDCD